MPKNEKLNKVIADNELGIAFMEDGSSDIRTMKIRVSEHVSEFKEYKKYLSEALYAEDGIIKEPLIADRFMQLYSGTDSLMNSCMAVAGQATPSSKMFKEYEELQNTHKELIGRNVLLLVEAERIFSDINAIYRTYSAAEADNASPCMPGNVLDRFIQLFDKIDELRDRAEGFNEATHEFVMRYSQSALNNMFSDSGNGYVS